jgi:hypothetical protein
MRTVSRLTVVGATILLLAVALAAPASAISPQQRCEELGGTYGKDRGTATCTIVETPGNNQGGVTKDTTESQKGSFTSAHEEDSATCVNNKGGEHCPSGRQSGGSVLPL